MKTIVATALIALLLVVVASASTSATPTPTTWGFNKTRHGLIKNFEATLRWDANLRAGVVAAIQSSKTHCPSSNCSDPWTLADFLDHLNHYLYFVGSPQAPRYGPVFGSTLNAPVWTQHPAAVKFVENFQIARGVFLYSPATLQAVTEWMGSPKVNMSDFVTPAGGFSSWGEFFTRELRPGARPVSGAPGDDTVIVSPVDATVEVPISFIDGPDARIHGLKGGMPINISQLLGPTLAEGKQLAKKFVGGAGVILSLSVYDYHRWHAPMAGVVTNIMQLGNMYWCTPPGTSWFPDLGYYFRRSPIILENRNASSNASGFTAAFVPVGIAEYGSCIPYVEAGSSVEKASEIGQFDLGGSMAFLAFDGDFDVELTVRPGEAVKVGQQIAKIKSRKGASHKKGPLEVIRLP